MDGFGAERIAESTVHARTGRAEPARCEQGMAVPFDADMLRDPVRAASLFLATLFAVDACAQVCARPDPPVGGFPVTSDALVQVPLSDGYVSLGTLTRPQATPPSCRWPLVVFVHPLGQNHGHDVGLQLLLASQGYAVWSFDVRGQGFAAVENATHANLGSAMWGPVEVLDLAEQIQFVVTNPVWTGTIDATRIAVTGSSQGGGQAWSAAARSGQTVQVPGRPPLTMPVIGCVVANDLVADAGQDWIRDGVLFSTFFANVIAGAYAQNGVPMDAAFVQAGRTAFLAQDAPSLLAGFVAEGRTNLPQLAASTVPVLWTHSYHDFVSDPLSGLVALQGMTSPHRALLGTGGHHTPANTTERAFHDATMLRWLNRFLWGMPNEVEFEAPYLLAELPLGATQPDDPAFVWSRAHLADPLQPPTTTRRYLCDDLQLTDVPPTAPQVDGPIVQVIDPLAVDFHPAGWLDVPTVRDLPNVLQACPLHERVYSFVTASETQLEHASRLHLKLVPDRPE